MKFNLLLLCTLTFIYSELYAQTFPKTELRGTWTASVYNLDWPGTRGVANKTVQQNELIALFDSLKSAGLNTVFLQVRPNCDALYSSPYEPWSYWLTGTEGTPPNPLWDPLSFAISEAHARGMELHAWINPYRVKEGASTATHSSHVINQHPAWVLTVGTEEVKILNPGLEEVRNYLVQIITDIVTRYDVDGIHFDDYFYPYSPNSITTEDAQTYADYPRGFSSISNWRRDNINILIQAVKNAITSVKPYVQFGISPFGIWKSGTPSGITGTSAYSELYCDAIAWLQQGSVDYIMPQLYWKIGGSQDYQRLMTWWADSAYANNRMFYPGQQFTTGYTNSELPAQLTLNRANSKVKGYSLFRADKIPVNTFGFKDSLKNNYNRYKAILPALTFLNNVLPNAPTSLTVSYNGNLNLSWTAPAAAADGDLARYYIVYRSSTSNVDITNPANIIAVLFKDVTSYTDLTSQLGSTYYYAVTALDPYHNESAKSNEVTLRTQTLLADFESGAGLFNRIPTYSGSTVGISKLSTSTVSLEAAHTGSNSLKVVLKDSAAISTNWSVRLLSGSGTPSNNTQFSTTGYLSLWVKTSSAPAGAQISISIRDGGIAGAPLEIGVKRNVINDNAWHLYQWNLDNAADWTVFTGNGIIDSTLFTLDAVMMYAANGSPDWTSYLDDVAYDLITPLPVEFTPLAASVNGNKIKISWQTITEMNSLYFEIERREVITSSESEWLKLGSVNASGNSNSMKDYFYDDVNLNSGRYQYRIKNIDINGSYNYSDIVEAEITTPVEYELAQNYPNPFNPSTTINYKIPAAGKIQLTVYDILGNEVSTLVNEYQEAGNYRVEFNSKEFSSGVYIYRLTAGSFIQTKKMMILK